MKGQIYIEGARKSARTQRRDRTIL